MSLRSGEIVLDRFKLMAELPGTADLWRWSAEDQRTGALVEVVASSPTRSTRSSWRFGPELHNDFSTRRRRWAPPASIDWPRGWRESWRWRRVRQTVGPGLR